MVARIIPVDPFDLVIFGASGDLSRRKILPGLFRRLIAGQMPPNARIIGSARSKWDDKQFREEVSKAIKEFSPNEYKNTEKLEEFLETLHYIPVDVLGDAGWKELGKLIEKDANPVRAFYLSVGPSLFDDIAERLTKTGIATKDSRIVVEKPFGHDLETAHLLNEQLRRNFKEHQIYRIDHYLGKETVQNLMALRFANALLEPVWNSQHVDHVQISVSETIGIEGRGAYYDNSGAMRDMVQNHLMQLLCLTAMEPPARFEANDVRDEKLKVIRSLDPVEPDDIVRGQYRANGDSGSYKDDAENPDSKTESFIAIKAHISNWRWTGVPFYLRTGKKLRARMSEISIIFKDPPHSIFPNAEVRHGGNSLVIRLQPDEGITMHMIIKEPGQGGLRLTEVPLDMSFADALKGATLDMADAYERLLMDVIRGDQTLFMRGDEVEAAWAWVDPIIENWVEAGDTPEPYDAGGSGPDGSLALMHRDDRRWRPIEV